MTVGRKSGPLLWNRSKQIEKPPPRHALGFKRCLVTAAALAVLATACTGERPELVSADLTSTTVGQDTVAPTDSVAEAAPTPAAIDGTTCVTAPGAGPWLVTIEATPEPPVPCGRVGAHQRVEFVNNTPELVSFALAGTPVMVQPGATYLTEPVGTILAAGPTDLVGEPHPVSDIWLVEESEAVLAGQRIGLNSLGDLTIGSAASDVAQSVGGAPLAAAEGPCYTTSLDGDPYSPLLTVRDGTLAVIQIFAPGQLTRSEIGVGSGEPDVMAAYSPQIEEQPSPDGAANKKLLVFVPSDEADQQYRLVFTIENGVVSSIRNGLTEYVTTNPGC